MPRRILIGSSNPSKIAWLKDYLSGISDVECVTLSELGVTTEVPEDGQTPEENARQKALAYHRATGLAVVSHDSGLYFQEFSMDDSRQPGLHIRRVRGTTLNDGEMMAYYSGLALKYGPFHACYCSGFAVVNEAGYVESFMQDDPNDPEYIDAFGFLLCSTPHEKRHIGWPLDSLCKDLHTGEYWFDQADEAEYSTESPYVKQHRQNVNHFFSQFFKSN